MPTVLTAIAAGSFLTYAILDGRDLGAGSLVPLIARRTDTAALFRALVPFWDGNELWLILGILVILAGIPLTHATIIPLIERPLILMLSGFALRAVSYECQRHQFVMQRIWQLVFAYASIVTTFCQGWILGLIAAAIAPFSPIGGALGSIAEDLLPAACGLGLLGVYALLGSCWLISRTRGPLQVLGREVAFSALILTTILLPIISVWILLTHPYIARQGPSPHHLVPLWPLSLGVVIFGWRLKRSLWGAQASRPLLWASLLSTAVSVTIGASVHPFIIPYSPTDSWKLQQLPWWTMGAVIAALVVTLVCSWLARRYSPVNISPPCDPTSASMPHISTRRTSGRDADLHLS